MTESGRDRCHSWLLFVAGIAFIILTLDLAFEVSQFLRSRGYLWQTVKVFFVAAGVLMAYSLWFGAGIRRPAVYLRTIPAIAAFIFAVAETRTSPAERFHFIEYGVLYLLALRALVIDIRSWPSYLLALVVTAAAGWLDEWLQGLSAVRYYDVEDIQMNVLASVMAALVCFSLFGLKPELARFTYFKRKTPEDLRDQG